MEESRERRLDHQGLCGVFYSIDLGGDLNDKIYIYKHLGLSQPLIDHFTTTNQKQEDAVEERIRERRRDHRGAWGVVPPF